MKTFAKRYSTFTLIVTIVIVSFAHFATATNLEEKHEIYKKIFPPPTQEEIEEVYESFPKEHSCPEFRIVEDIYSDDEISAAIFNYLSDGLWVTGLTARPVAGERFPLLIVNHGGTSGLTEVDRRRIYDFARRGFLVLASTYRGEAGIAGRSEGEVSFLREEVSDMLNLLECGKKMPEVDTERIAMLGGSHGGGITLLAIERTDALACAVVWAGPADMFNKATRKLVRDWMKNPEKVEMWLGIFLEEGMDRISEFLNGISRGEPSIADARKELLARSPLYFTEHITCPLLFFYGGRDPLVSVEDAEALAERLGKQGKVFEYKIYPTQGHSIMGDDRDNAEKIMAEFFDKYVGTGAESSKKPEYLNLGEVVVTAGRTPTSFSSLSRNVEILDKDDINGLPVSTVPEVLEYAAGVDVRNRGPGGVQADVHIRGSGFNQVAVLIDGLQVNDSQTGHHNMDIPLTLNDVERIEILHGQASSLYGPNAVGGVVNIITDTPGEPETRLETAGGKYGTQRIALSRKDRRYGLSAERSTSDGYRFDTDYNTEAITFNSRLKTGKSGVRMLAGYSDKQFGADSFYVPGWPSREHTQTRFVNLKIDRDREHGGSVRADIFHRRHYDRFICSVLQPSLCDNIHRTYRTGGELVRRYAAPSGKHNLVAGVLLENDRIKSSNMGEHSNNHSAAFLKHGRRVSNRLDIDAGARIDNHGGYGSHWSWSLSSAYRVDEKTSLKCSAGKAFRPPTFTELYYDDPAHVSFDGLLPEEAVSYELGMNHMNNGVEFSVAFYTREVSNLIDWTRPAGTSSWRIGNNNARFSGANTTLRIFRTDSFYWSLSYDYLQMSLNDRMEYKYTDARPEQQLQLGARWFDADRNSLDVRLNYKESKQQKDIIIVDAGINKPFPGGELYLHVNNLFNRSYEDVQGMPMPGLRAVIGFKQTWKR